ncbi:MAG: response regulator [bacterium]
MTLEKILVVDDEEDILELIKYSLIKEGFQAICVATGEDALRAARSQLPDLIILDLMLPGIGGLEVCWLLKRDIATRPIPIIMLTARGNETDVVTGLERGADDYIVKPFSPKILMARVRAVLRRKHLAATIDESTVIQYHGLMIDPNRYEVRISGQAIELTATEFRILHNLAQHPGRVFTRSQIVDAARGKNYPVTDRSVDVHVTSLRKKLGSSGKLIETVRGLGYRFKE